jgi:mRNA interferase MazF
VNYVFSDVLLLEYPSSDLRAIKIRPAIVLLDTGDEDLLVAKVTSQPARDPFDVALLDWEEEGLRTESFVRSHKLFTLDKALIVRRLGSLTKSDNELLKKVLQQLWSSL